LEFGNKTNSGVDSRAGFFHFGNGLISVRLYPGPLILLTKFAAQITIKTLPDSLLYQYEGKGITMDTQAVK
jgi:hypothetical protein